MFDLKKIPAGGIWIPSAAKGSDWLVVALHGSEGSAKDFEGLEKIFNVPAFNYLYLNGPIRSYGNFRWYSTPEGVLQAVAYLNNVFKYLFRAGYAPRRTFLLGFSQGGALVFEFGARYPLSFAGYVSVSGRIEGLPALLNQAKPGVVQKGKWLVTHGTRDFNLSVDLARAQVAKLSQAGFAIDYQEYDKIHEFDGTRELPYIRDWVKNIYHRGVSFA